MFCIPLIAAVAAGAYLITDQAHTNCVVGDVDFGCQCWLDNPICRTKKMLAYDQCMADKGHKCWLRTPEYVAVNFLNNEFICDDHKGSTASVCDMEVCCDKAYVVLIFADCSKMAFELYQPVKKGECGIWHVRRYAYV